MFHIRRLKPQSIREWAFYALMMSLTVGLRLPFQARFLSNHDAVNYALALDHFDMRLSQPHPPGYILYILLGRLINTVLDHHLQALVWLSILASALAVVIIYMVGRDLFSRRVGVMAASLLCLNPTFWLFGEVALPYTPDLYVSTLIGWLCWRTANVQAKKWALLTGFSLGLAGAFRPQTMVFLLPLFLYALLSYPMRTVALSLCIQAITFSVFFVPSVIESGGPLVFVRLMQGIVPVFRSTRTAMKSVRFGRYIRNVDMVLRYVFRVMGELGVPLVLVGGLTTSGGRRRFWRTPKLHFLALWVLPTWLVYLLIWPGNLGTILVCTPPFFLLASAGLDRILNVRRLGKPLCTFILLIVLMWELTSFTLFPRYPLGVGYREFDNNQRLIAIDTYYQAKFELLDQIPHEGTVIFANDFRHLQYYRPTYRTFSHPYLDKNNPTLIKLVMSVQDGKVDAWSDLKSWALIPENTRRVVFFDLPFELVKVDARLITEKSRAGNRIYVIDVPEGHTAFWTEEGLMLAKEGVEIH